MCSPSAVVHSASAATGSSGLVGAGGRVLDGRRLCRPVLEESGLLLGIRAAGREHAAAAMTPTSRFIAATPQFYGRRFSWGLRNIATHDETLSGGVSRRLLVIGGTM